MTDWKHCYNCPRPAVCFGADLVAPQYRCPRCCRSDYGETFAHGPDDYLADHEAAEGTNLP